MGAASTKPAHASRGSALPSVVAPLGAASAVPYVRPDVAVPPHTSRVAHGVVVPCVRLLTAYTDGGPFVYVPHVTTGGTTHEIRVEHLGGYLGERVQSGSGGSGGSTESAGAQQPYTIVRIEEIDDRSGNGSNVWRVAPDEVMRLLREYS